jgi:ribosomal protein L16/L10AE
MLKADDFNVNTREISGLTVNITSYKIGNKYYCHIDNIDPGATIVRLDGESKEEVIQTALDRAMQRLSGKTP